MDRMETVFSSTGQGATCCPIKCGRGADVCVGLSIDFFPRHCEYGMIKVTDEVDTLLPHELPDMGCKDEPELITNSSADN
jgi:hypothetical protein